MNAILARLRRPDLLDGLFAVALVTLAVATLRTTYDGYGFLFVGFAGAALGALIAGGVNAFRLPWVSTPFLLAVGYFLLGGAFCLGADPRGSRLPTPGTWRELIRLLLHGWTQLLTTLPPVAGDGPLLFVPFVIGLVGAGLSVTLAGRSRNSGLPLLGSVLALGAAILLGTSAPGTVRLVGIASGGLALAWLALRAQRRIVQTSTGRNSRVVTAVVLLAVAVGVVTVAAPGLPGSGSGGRTVLRSHVTPPLDISAFPSPLAGFRKYRPASDQLADQTLFTVQGLPAGYPVRIATLDDYNGVVWAARNSSAAVAASGEAADTFQRVGARIATSASGPRATVRVTIGPAYAAATDTNGWLPDAGAVTGISFHGSDSSEHAQDVRYNLSTDSAVVPERLRAGDSYTLHAVLPSAGVPTDAQPYGGTQLDPSVYGFVVAPVSRWTTNVSGTWTRLLAVATYLHDNGAYSDGGPGETQFLPGHSTGRLTAFLGGKQLVGDDEQYAATFALMANEIGVPARVVLGAIPEADGTVKGADVHAWVEVHVANGQWIRIPQDTFMPPTTKKPQKQTQEQTDNSNSSVVPPPNSIRPPSSLGQFSQTGSDNSRRSQHETHQHAAWQLPGFVVGLLRWGTPVLAVLLLFVGSVTVTKLIRRRRRRRARTPGARIALGWREILDQARDLGQPVDPRSTRHEQAAKLGDALVPLAGRADGSLFGPDPATPAAASDYWAEVLRARRDLLLGVGRWQRMRARVSLRSLRPLTTPD